MMTASEFRQGLKTLDLTQEAFAGMLGIASRTVRRWIADDVIPPEIAVLVRIMIKYEISPEGISDLLASMPVQSGP
jgi:DNA-binding transcriptional regulator YiaG